MKNLVFVITSIAVPGGAQRVMANLANRFAASGYRVTILSILGGEAIYPLSPGIQSIDLTELTRAKKGFIGKVKRWFGLGTALRSLHPDLVLSFMAGTNLMVLFALLLSGIPVIVSDRNDPARDPKRPELRLLRRILYPFAAGYVFQTPDAMAFFGKRIRRRGRVIPNMLSSGLPVRDKSRVEPVIAAAGRFVDAKNFPLLIRAFARIAGDFPSTRLVIYGEGGARSQKLADLVHTLGLTDRVLFPGYEPQLPGRLCTAALFVLSSDYEGMPNVLMEAMAMGIPSIATDCPCGGPAFLIKDGETGRLTPVGDESALAGAMAALLRDPLMAEHLGEQAAADIRERLSPEAIFAQWEAYLLRIAG